LIISQIKIAGKGIETESPETPIPIYNYI